MVLGEFNLKAALAKLRKSSPAEFQLFFLKALLDDNVGAVARLLEAGADPNGTAEGIPFLHLAVRAGRADVAAALIAGGAKLDAVDAEGCQPLHAAVLHGHVSLAELLIEAGAAVNARAHDAKTPSETSSDRASAFNNPSPNTRAISPPCRSAAGGTQGPH